LCGRSNITINEHHLIPKTTHSSKFVKKNFSSNEMNKTIDVCLSCHKNIHTSFSEKDLARTYNNRDILLSSDRISKFADWIRDKPEMHIVSKQRKDRRVLS